MPHALNFRRLVVRSLLHYWRTNLAIVLGVVVGTAVIGGALIVGDSVRASLRQMTLDRLGGIDLLVTGHRFFREDLATAVASQFPTQDGGASVAPAFVLVGSVEKQTETVTRRAGQVNVFGMDERGWSLVAPGNVEVPKDDGAILNSALAAALGAKEGDQITLWIELPSAVPSDTLLGKKDNDSKEITLTVKTILADEPGAARLGLLPTQQLPINLFVSLDQLQDALDLASVRPTRRDPEGERARVNTLLSRRWSAESNSSKVTAASSGADIATKALAQSWTLEDLDLRIVHDQILNVMVLETEQMLLENRFADGAMRYARSENLPASPMMVYLANSLKNPKDPQAFSMYSTVAGLDVLDLDEAFGPFEFVGASPDTFGDDDVILNEYVARDLKVGVGDVIEFAYHVVGSHGELPEEVRTATVRGIVKMTGAAVDRQLTPTVKGITDAESLDDWDQPFPMNLDAVTTRDDEYWDEYRATPKAFFPLDRAQKLWPNRYGNFTSVRVGLKSGQTFEEGKAALERFLLAALDPKELGLAFQPVKAQGLAAANGATDFTQLFAGFSMFLILAAVILVGLLFRLAVEQRVRQFGLLSAVGCSPAMVRRLMLAEGSVLVVIGGAVGAAAAVAYAQLMLFGLKTWWIGAVGTKFLMLSVEPASVALGVISAVIASLVAVVSGLWQLRRVSIREQLVGVADPSPISDPGAAARVRFRAIGSFSLALLLILGTVTGLIPAKEAFSGLSWTAVVFFLAGMLFLAAGLWGLSAWLQREDPQFLRQRGPRAIVRLGVRNAARRRQRSVLTAGLMASAAFVIAAVAAGHQNPAAEHPDKNSGNGGFTLVGECSTPILYDLNTPAGRKTLNLQPKSPEQEQVLAAMHVVQFRVRPGEDASCLNLFQTSVPKILGVPQSMIERGGFEFVGGGAHPWEVLNGRNEDGTIPVLGDMNTLMFSLKKSPGDVIAIPSEQNPQHRLRVAGMFNGAVFQGVLLMSEANFLKLFPEQKGYRYFLVEIPPSESRSAAELLETDLAEYGFDTEPVAERLARFLAVQNTYLSTFQSLGGLGLLLGTFGLATVMLRNVLERQAELALLRAVGFRPGQVAMMVLAESLLLLVWGLLTGTVSAVLSMLPQLMTTGADVPWLSGAALLFGVGLLGMLSTWWAVRAATSVPIVSTLRGE